MMIYNNPIYHAYLTTTTIKMSYKKNNIIFFFFNRKTTTDPFIRFQKINLTIAPGGVI